MPAAKKLTTQQQRDRRAKIMLGVLGVVLLGVLALQLPKVLNPSKVAAPPPSNPTVTVDAAGAALAAAKLASATEPAAGQLVRFTRFAVKNPFHPLVSMPAGKGATATTPQAGGAAPKPPKKPKTSTVPTVTFSLTQNPAQSAGPVVPQVPAALLMVNGKKRVLALNSGFPHGGALFRVVSLSQKAVWIQLIGGTLANGSQTIKLVRGRKITLVNTTTGKRYVLSLVKPTTAPAPPKPPAKPAAPATTTTTTSTTQTSPTITTPLSSG